MKHYMHKVQWYDLTVSLMLHRRDDISYLLLMLCKQKNLGYLTLWIDNEEFMVLFRRILKKILVLNSLKLYVVQGQGHNAWYTKWARDNPRYDRSIKWRCKLFILSGNKESYDQKVTVKSLCDVG